MNTTNKIDLLTDSDTSELEIMEFTIADEIFGINVAKVREILQYSAVKPMQNAHPVIEGIFKPRDAVITVVDLAKYLGLPPAENTDRNIFIVTNFNNTLFAFHVHSVVGINPILWSDIQKPHKIIYGSDEGVASGIATFENRLITILDFEKIVMEISSPNKLRQNDIALSKARAHSDKTILIAEDSMMLSRLLVQSLHSAGYENIIKTDDGREAWEALCLIRDSGHDAKDAVACVVTDIEMPQMDGHTLTKRIKDDPILREIPVVIFSSLINEETYAKGEMLGANAQMSKPDINSLIALIDEFTGFKSETPDESKNGTE